MRERDSALDGATLARRDDMGRSLALWFGLFGAPVLWAMEFMVNYGIASHACYPRDLPLTTSVIPWMRVILGAIVVLAAVGSVAAWVTAFTHWRAARVRLQTVPSRQEDSRISFMAFSGILLSTLFLFLILLNGVPLLIVQPCSYGA